MIGILDCDRIEPMLASQFGQYGDMIAVGLRRVRPELSCELYAGQVAVLPRPERCDAWVISGSRHSAYDAIPWVPRLAQWIREAFRAGRPLAGICFGHQILAQALGGRVERARQGWGMGPYRVEVVANLPWMNPLVGQLTLPASHRDQVTALPEDARLWLRSEFCPHYGFAIDDRVFTVQGHPEFTIAYNRILAERRRTQLGEAVYQRALAGFDLPVDCDRCLGWLAAFLERSW